MKFSELYRKLEENGWVQKKGTKHIKYVHPDFPKPIPVGRHKSQEVPADRHIKRDIERSRVEITLPSHLTN